MSKRTVIIILSLISIGLSLGSIVFYGPVIENSSTEPEIALSFSEVIEEVPTGEFSSFINEISIDNVSNLISGLGTASAEDMYDLCMSFEKEKENCSKWFERWLEEKSQSSRK